MRHHHNLIVYKRQDKNEPSDPITFNIKIVLILQRSTPTYEHILLCLDDLYTVCELIIA